MSFRVGIGFDAHRRVMGRPLVLGGVRIESDWGLEAHSDGDVIAHAVLDALLGACALGDKGMHFPPTDPRYKDIRSTELLSRAAALLGEHGYRIGNVDATVICEEPKLTPHVLAMREALSKALGVDASQVSVKPTTSEKLGFAGRGEGIAAMATVLVERI